MERHSSMEESSESKKLRQRSQSESEGSDDQREAMPSINISEGIQPLPMHPFQMGSTYGQGFHPTQQYPRIVEGLMQSTNYFSQPPLEFNIQPNPILQSYPLHSIAALPQHLYSQPYQQLFPMCQHHLQPQLQPQYSMIAPCVMNRALGSQCPTTTLFPDLSAQGRLTLQPQNYPQPFQYPTLLSNSEGQHGNGAGIYNVRGREEVLTTNVPVVRIYEKEKSQASSSTVDTNINPEFLSVDLEIRKEESTILLLCGAQIKILEIECYYLNRRRQTYLLSIIRNCPNVEELKLEFKSFHPRSYKPNLMSFTNIRFECSPLKNLSTFEFISDIACQPNYASTTLKIGMEFFDNVFKEIVKSCENLKYLVIRTSKLVGYLEAMTGNSEIANKFNQLHTLRLWTEVDDVELVNMNALLKFLTIVSSSLENLHLCHFKSIDLSSYPLMAKLRTIIIESDIKYSSLNVLTSSLPQLRNLILRHVKSADLNVEVGWPLNEDIFRPDQVGNGISEDLIPPPLNIVLYLCWKLFNTEGVLSQFLQKISQARVNAVFIDFARNVYTEQDMWSVMKRISRYVRDTPSLKRCLLRSTDTSEGPPKVIDVMQFR